MKAVVRKIASKQFRYANAAVWGYVLQEMLASAGASPRSILDVCGADGLFLDTAFPGVVDIEKFTLDKQPEPDSIRHGYIQHDMYSEAAPDMVSSPELLCFLNSYDLLDDVSGIERLLERNTPGYVFVSVPTKSTLAMVSEVHANMNAERMPVEIFLKNSGYQEIDRACTMKHHYLEQPLRLLLDALLMRIRFMRKRQILGSGYYKALLFKRIS